MAEASVDFSAIKKHQQQIVKVSALVRKKCLPMRAWKLNRALAKLFLPVKLDLQMHQGKVKIVLLKISLLPGVPCRKSCRESSLRRILTSDGILNLNSLPSSIIIVGGSVIGVEFATFFAELGSKVTIVEILDRIIPLEDQECAEMLSQELTRMGVAINTATKLESMKDTGSDVVMLAQKNGKQLDISADYALLCTGRKPLLNAEELEKLGIEYTKAGIKVDKNMMTNIAGIYAVGDVTGGMMLAHRAAQQAKIAAGHICGDNDLFITKISYLLLYTAIRK